MQTVIPPGGGAAVSGCSANVYDYSSGGSLYCNGTGLLF